MQHGRLMPALVVSVVAALAVTSPAGAVHTDGQAGLHVAPDLQTLKPANFSIQSSKRGRNRTEHLLFDNEVMNLHTGPLEVRPTEDKCSGAGGEGRVALQRVYVDSSGNGGWRAGEDTGFSEAPVGCMTFHKRHHHWHFDEFSRFELRATAGGTLAGSSKMTFCIIDINRHADLLDALSAAFSPFGRGYGSCGRSAPQGLSVGWGDVYVSGTAGQYIDVTGVADGVYCFVSTADPLEVLTETVETNNVASTEIALGGAGTGTRTVAPTANAAACH